MSRFKKNGATTVRTVASRVLPRAISDSLRRAVEHITYPPDLSEEATRTFRNVEPFTMTSPERIAALRDSVCYTVMNEIEGCFVECGVWRGGSMMAVAETLMELGKVRELYLFDTFEGMSQPTALDVAWSGANAEQLLQRTRKTAGRNLWCIADEEDVRRNMQRTGYDTGRIHLVRGKVEDTLPGSAPERIALLRLDTDWYESTRHELQTLYPRLCSGGVLIVDDYGHWQGARRAVDEYLATLDRRPLLNRIDATARLAIKP